MRLICPNCDANYEVDASVIPENGREVQCSACGDTWFQTRSDEATAAAPQPPRVARPVTRAEIQPPVAPPEDVTTAAEPQRRELDESVLDILREEAAHEEIARETEREVPGLAEAFEEQVAEVTLVQEETTLQEEAAHGADLLPDIDMINSTLQADADHDEEITPEEEAPVKSSSGFGRGFTMMLLLIILAAVVYTSAPKIVAFWPAGEPYISAYVGWVDSLRASLDSLMGNATESLSSLTEGS